MTQTLGNIPSKIFDHPKWVYWVNWCCWPALCAIPWLVIFGAYMEVCLVRLTLSRWPTNLDDPKQVAVEPLHLLVMLLFISLAVAIPSLIVLAICNWRKFLSDWRYSAHVGTFAAGILILWALINYDPGNVWFWFFD